MGVQYRRDNLSMLERSIDSVLCQTYCELELIICERGSTAHAKQLLKSYCETDSRVKLIDGETAKSFSEQLNMCIAQAKGDFIARMDDDDYSYPERFERQLNYLYKNPEAAFVGCNVKLMQDGADAGFQRFPENPQVKDFLFSMPFIHPSLVFRKQALEAVGGYSELDRCERCEDYDLLLRLYEKGYFGANLQTEYFIYTLPPNGVTSRSFRDRVNETKTRFARYKALKLLPIALPYALKPLAVWLVPSRALALLKRKIVIKK